MGVQAGVSKSGLTHLRRWTPRVEGVSDHKLDPHRVPICVLRCDLLQGACRGAHVVSQALVVATGASTAPREVFRHRCG